MATNQAMLKAFRLLFNQRAQALRGEAYEKLCVLVLDEDAQTGGKGLTQDEVAEKLAALLGVAPTEGLRTIVTQTLHDLGKQEKTQTGGDGRLTLDAAYSHRVRPEIEVSGYEDALNGDIVATSRVFAPVMGDEERGVFVDVFKQAVHRMGDYQANFIARVFSNADHVDSSPDMYASLKQDLADKGLEDKVDFDALIVGLFHNPRPAPRSYITWWIQGKVLFEILGNNPDLDEVRRTAVAGKTLYLDSNVLFALFIDKHQFHDFVTHLLAASRDELGVALRVHKLTLDEFHGAVDYQDQQFSAQNAIIRDVVRLCKESGADPADEIEEPLIADFIRANRGSTNIQQWRRFVEPLNPLRIKARLRELKIEIDNTYCRLPADEYEELKGIFQEASYKRARSNPGKRHKHNPGHDAMMFRLITDTRKRISEHVHISHDKYLLSIDGSLPLACQMLEQPLDETYFLFPSQWYEVVFPFLRVDAVDMARSEAALAAMLSGIMFPTLRQLVPLEMYEYIFAVGGDTLQFPAVKNIALEAEEERRQDIQAHRHPLDRERARQDMQRRVLEARLESDEKVIAARAEMEEASSAVAALTQKEQELSQRVEALNEQVARGDKSEQINAELVSTLKDMLGQFDSPPQAIINTEAALAQLQRQLANMEERARFRGQYFEDRVNLLLAQNELVRERLIAEKEEVLANLRSAGAEKQRLYSELGNQKELAARHQRHKRWLVAGSLLCLCGLTADLIVRWLLR